MGEEAEFLFSEGLISTAFLGGVWTAIGLDPEVVLIDALGQVLAELAGSGTASSYVAIANIGLFIGFLFVVIGVFAIGGKLGLAGFVSMWISGFLLIHGVILGIVFLFGGWGLGALAILIHTDESPRAAPTRRAW